MLVRLLACAAIAGALLFACAHGALAGDDAATPLTGDPAEDRDPTWSPNGATIAFSSDRSSAGQFRIYTMSSSGGSATMVTMGEMDEHPSWSPNPLLIAFSRTEKGNQDVQILSLDLGGGVTPLTSDPAPDFHPTWSPDGSKIAFTSGRSGNLDIWVADLPTLGRGIGGPTQLTTNAGLDAYPAWSPDGQFIAFTSDRDGDRDIYLMPATGGQADKLTTSEAEDMEPTWSADNARIYFASDRDGPATDIYFLDLAGRRARGAAVRVTYGAADDADPAAPPSGTFVLFDSLRNGSSDIWVIDLTTPTRQVSWGALKARF